MTWRISSCLCLFFLISCSNKNEKEPFVTFKIVDYVTKKPRPYIPYVLREYEDHFYALAHRHYVSEGCSNEDGEFSIRVDKSEYYDLEIEDCQQFIFGIQADSLNHGDTVIINCKQYPPDSTSVGYH